MKQFKDYEKFEGLLESFILLNYSNGIQLLGPIFSGSLAIATIQHSFALYRKILKKPDEVGILEFLGPFLESISASILFYAEINNLFTDNGDSKLTTSLVYFNLSIIMRTFIDLYQKKIARLPSGVVLLTSLWQSRVSPKSLFYAGVFRFLSTTPKSNKDFLKKTNLNHHRL